MTGRHRTLCHGARFGLWTVLTPNAGKGRRGQRMCKVRCDCGTERNIPANEVRRGVSKSCGCARRKGKFSSTNLQWGFGLAGNEGRRVTRGAKPTPGGTVLTPEVVEHMRRYGVTKIDPMEPEQ